ncbi:hypothetical protein [Actinomadura sp. DC4]|uniref:hypothetical protein n=1 Tax=Actinomadura sp. DC4 TaxID=3055069 RepID=UPI0025AF299C|nr:hypothetical protein [Actinomadura sp. DC4]MDN3354771.1 hypothetical protein [Actinomadura sp. DC4]
MNGKSVPFTAAVRVSAVALPLALGVVSHAMAPARALATAPAPSPTPGQAVKFYVVAPAAADGQQEFLFEIAQKTLGNGDRFGEIFDLTKGRLQRDGGRLTDPTRIKPGWVLILPDDASGPGVRQGRIPIPVPTAPRRTGTDLLVPLAGTGAGGVALLAGTVLYVRRRRRTAAPPGETGPVQNHVSLHDPGENAPEANGPRVKDRDGKSRGVKRRGGKDRGREGRRGDAGPRPAVRRSDVTHPDLVIPAYPGAEPYSTAPPIPMSHLELAGQTYPGTQPYPGMPVPPDVPSGDATTAPAHPGVPASPDVPTGDFALRSSAARTQPGTPPYPGVPVPPDVPSGDAALGPTAGAAYPGIAAPSDVPTGGFVLGPSAARTYPGGSTWDVPPEPAVDEPSQDVVAAIVVRDVPPATGPFPTDPVPLVPDRSVRPRHAGPAVVHDVSFGDDLVTVRLTAGAAVAWRPLPHDVPPGRAVVCVGAAPQGCLFLDLGAAPGAVTIEGPADAAERLAEAFVSQLATGPAGASVALVGDVLEGVDGGPAVRRVPDLNAAATTPSDLVIAVLPAGYATGLGPLRGPRVVQVRLGGASDAAWSLTLVPDRATRAWQSDDTTT